jgi:hypothetical protein
MQNNNKSRGFNAVSFHAPLTNNNVSNVWSVNLTNTYTPGKNAAGLANLEQLQKYSKNMFEGKARFDRELYKGIQARLKIESNAALRFFNKPSSSNSKTTAKKRKLRRQTRRR